MLSPEERREGNRRERKGRAGKRRWDRNSEKLRPCEDGSRDQSCAATSQGMSGVARSQQKFGEKHERDSPTEHPEGTNPLTP